MSEPNQGIEAKEEGQAAPNGSYEMVSHVDRFVKSPDSGKTELIPAYEPFLADEETAFAMREKEEAAFAGEGRDEAEEAYNQKLADESDEFVENQSLGALNAAAPVSASIGMKGRTAAESNAMPASYGVMSDEDLDAAAPEEEYPYDRTVVVVSDPMYDGVRGVYKDIDKIIEESK